MDIYTESRNNLAESSKWDVVLAGLPFFLIKIPGTQTVASTGDKSQASLQSSQATNGKEIILVEEWILYPYFSPQQCLDLHILDVSEVWAGSIASRDRNSENLKL